MTTEYKSTVQTTLADRTSTRARIPWAPAYTQPVEAQGAYQARIDRQEAAYRTEPTQSERAHAAELAYFAPEKRHAEMQRLGLLENYGIDANHNMESLVVLHHRHSKHTLVIHRGTSLERSPVQDLMSDANIVANTFNKGHFGRFQSSLVQTKQVMRKYKDRTIENVGHSLGGTTAHYVGMQTGTDSHAFNPGHSWIGTWNTPDNKGGQHHVYVTDKDWISEAAKRESSKGAIVHVNQDKVGRPHSIENWY